MNIFLRELRANFKSFMIWSATMVFLVAAGMMKYSAFSKTGEAVNEMFDKMPPGILAVMGIDPGSDLSSIGVFYSIFFLYFMLLMVVHSALLGASIIAKEERDKTADFLLVKPIKRYQVVTPKIMAAMTMVVLFNLVTFVASVLMVSPLNETGPSLTMPIFRLTTLLLVIQILFLGIGLCFGAWASRAERASGLVTAVILGTFVLKILIDLNKDLDKLEFLTPFRYFKALKVMFDKELGFEYIIFSVAVAILTGAGTYYFFKKRDIRG
ncbi:MAG: ABC transporter permease [Saccharofermentanales bacterium]